MSYQITNCEKTGMWGSVDINNLFQAEIEPVFFNFLRLKVHYDSLGLNL